MRLPLASSLLLLAASFSSTLWAATATPDYSTAADTAGAEERVDMLLSKIKSSALDDCWATVNELVRLGRKAGPKATARLKMELKSGSELGKLAAARALTRLNDLDSALPCLQEMVLKGSKPEVRKSAAVAIGISPILFDDKATPAALMRSLELERDIGVRIAVAKTLWRIGKRSDGRQALVRLLKTSPEKAGQDEAALALAEMGLLCPPERWSTFPEGSTERETLKEIYTRVLELSLEPTGRGERASLLYSQMEDRAQQLNDPKISKGEAVVREVLTDIRKAYPDVSKIEMDKLFENACKGLVGTLDPYCQYMNEEEVQSTQEMLSQGYGGIGAYIGMRDNQFTVISPIYGAPAYNSGLRSQDIILEVEGEKATDLVDKGGLSRVITRLKGAPGTKVHVKYTRRGFNKPVEVDIVREAIKIESVQYSMLPGQIGYIRLIRFGERTAEEMDEALNELVKKQHARALMLDLRDNPGGLLRAGVEIADRFLAEGRLIVYSQGRDEFAPRKDFFATGSPDDEALPLVALVNGGSASASEIVAGALQDNKRAALIGEKTFGKGSVQQIIPIRATNGETQLRLTIAKYYLPTGRCIHEHGVDVDVKVKVAEMDDWTIRQILALRSKGTLEQWVADHWEKNRNIFVKLAEDDSGLENQYPDFVELRKTLESYRLPDNEIRQELRRIMRRIAQDDRKKEFVCDLTTDDYLQRGAFELLKMLKVDPSSVAQYKNLSEKFKVADDALIALPLPPAKDAEVKTGQP